MRFWVEPCGSIAVTRMALSRYSALDAIAECVLFPLNGPCRWMGTDPLGCEVQFHDSFPAVIPMVIAASHGSVARIAANRRVALSSFPAFLLQRAPAARHKAD